MITLAIRYTLDINKFVEFEAYVRALPDQIERCGGRFVGYYLPTKLAGSRPMRRSVLSTSRTLPHMSNIARICCRTPRRPTTCDAPMPRVASSTRSGRSCGAVRNDV